MTLTSIQGLVWFWKFEPGVRFCKVSTLTGSGRLLNFYTEQVHDIRGGAFSDLLNGSFFQIAQICNKNVYQKIIPHLALALFLRLSRPCMTSTIFCQHYVFDDEIPSHKIPLNNFIILVNLFWVLYWLKCVVFKKSVRNGCSSVALKCW